MSILSIMAAALDRELVERGVTVFDRDDCEAMVKSMMQRASDAAAGLMAAKETAPPEPRH